jgi:hypothetical protein
LTSIRPVPAESVDSGLNEDTFADFESVNWTLPPPTDQLNNLHIAQGQNNPFYLAEPERTVNPFLTPNNHVSFKPVHENNQQVHQSYQPVQQNLQPVQQSITTPLYQNNQPVQQNFQPSQQNNNQSVSFQSQQQNNQPVTFHHQHQNNQPVYHNYQPVQEQFQPVQRAQKTGSFRAQKNGSFHQPPPVLYQTVHTPVKIPVRTQEFFSPETEANSDSPDKYSALASLDMEVKTKQVYQKRAHFQKQISVGQQIFGAAPSGVNPFLTKNPSNPSYGQQAFQSNPFSTGQSSNPFM